MSEKEHRNEFTFLLYQEEILLCGRIFDADQFNPFTRYSVDIREILPWAITKFQKVLSRKIYETRVSENLDLYKYYQKMIRLYPAQNQKPMQYKPKTIVQHIDDKTIKGVECKLGLYINDNPIVERIFFVDGFNPISRWSVDIIDAVNDVVDTIFNLIKINDVKNMWDDYDLINKMGLSINRIRELSNYKRNELLKRIYPN